MVWFFIIVLAIFQGIGLLTFLHFKKSVKKSVVQVDTREPHEKLEMTKEDYDDALTVIYGPKDNDFNSYLNRPKATVIELPEVINEEDEIAVASEELPTEKDALLVSDDDSATVFEGVTEEEIEKLNQMNQRKKNPSPTQEPIAEEENPFREEDGINLNTDDPFEDDNGWSTFANDLDSLINHEPPSDMESEPVVYNEAIETTADTENIPVSEGTKEPEEPIVEQTSEIKNEDETTINFQMGQGPNVSYENRKKTEVGESIDLYKEVMAAVGEEVPESEITEPIDTSELFGEPIFISDDSIPATDGDVPVLEETEPEEQEGFIQMLNLIDMEASRLELETEGVTPSNQNEHRKQQLTERLTRLAEQGEGKDHMKEIVYTLYELYDLEGKKDEVNKLREEYKEYFLEEDFDLRIYEEDIIRVDKKKENPFKINQRYSWLASNKISEGKQGQQRWIGKVIGKNQSYIHFRDLSQRIWINVSSKIDQIEIGDLLVINVHRDGESVRAEEMYKLQEVDEDQLTAV